MMISLNDEDDVFISFIDRFLEFNHESRLHKFKVKSSDEEIVRFKDLVGKAVNRGIRYLDVKSSVYYREAEGDLYPCTEFMPLNIYTSKTLVSLKLSFSGLKDPGFVYLSCLKFMQLIEIRWVGTMNLEKLVSGCPVLEELSLLWDSYYEALAVTRVRSRSLKRFCLLVKEYGFFTVEHTLEIDAPGLVYMSLKEDFHRYVVKNLSSLFTIDLDIKFSAEPGVLLDPEDLSKINDIRGFLTGISSVKHMSISQQTAKALDLYSKAGPIPKFNDLSRLQAVYPSSSLQFLPALLESFPNLKHLSLNVVYSKELDIFELVSVPRCFLSSLECVELKGIFEWEEDEMKIASYFLENSAVLKKLVLSLVAYYPQQVPDSDIYKELDKLTKRSRRCQITVDHDYY